MNGVIQIPLWVAVSQWILLLALGLLVIIAYRQLSYLINLRDISTNAGTEKDGLPLGSEAPSFSYTLIEDSDHLNQQFSPRENWSLLLIADPECASCRNAVAALTKLEPQLKSKLKMLIITTSEPAFVEAVSEFHLSPVEIGYVDKSVVYKTYLTNTTPFLYIIDTEG